MPFESGTRLGHYEIAGQIGQGGMGEVYRARDTNLGREVAIKVLPAEFARDPERLARLEREARLLASLNHPNIAAIHGLEESGDTRFLVLELIEGETLADRLKAGAIPVEESLRLALQIAEALEAAHEKGVIHRDLKPANVKVTPQGRVKVLDFGLAKALVGDQTDVNLSHSPTLSMQATQAGVILGTAAYMSPEQARGEHADQRADVWAFGILLFEMLTGRGTFGGRTVSDVLAGVLAKEPPWESLPHNLHPRLRLLLERCVAKEVKDRYSGIGDARVDIESALRDPAGVIVPPVAEGARTGLRSRLQWVALAIVTALIGVGAGWVMRPAPAPGTVIRFPFVLPEDQNFTRPELSMVTISPDGAKLAYVANGQIYVRNMDETQSRPVGGTNPGGAGVAQPVFSPDGEWLAYVEVIGTTETILKRVPVTGGTPVTIFDDGIQVAPSWPTPDTIVFAHQRGILRIPATGGEAEVLVGSGPDEVFDSPQILPGGEAVLFTRAEGDPSLTRTGYFGRPTGIFVQTIGSADRTLVFDGGQAPRFLAPGHLVYAQGDNLFAIAFDPGARAVRGGSVPIVEGVRRSATLFSDTANYAVSGTGTLVVLPGVAVSNPATTLTLVDRNGVLSPLDVPPGVYRSPRVSPNGEQAAVEIIEPSGEGHIWIYDLSGDSAIRRLTQTGNNTRPIWTPDGERVTFGSEREGSWGIWERPPDGSTVAERLTTADRERRHFPDSWSPDGQTLAYTDADLANAQWDIWTFDRTTATSRIFVDGEANQFSAAYSPDGRWLAYTSTTPVFGIFVQPFPQTGAIFQITDQGEAAPVWTTDGREMFFRPSALTDPTATVASQIMGMEVSTTTGITFRNRRTLPIAGAIMTNGYRDFDITPDGEQFLMVYPVSLGESEAAETRRIDVVVNWVQELGERVPLD